MSNQLTPVQKQLKSYFESDVTKSKIEEILGRNPQPYITSVLAAVNGNEKLKQCSPESVYGAALVAATLNLPVDPNFGYAYIIPYKDRNKGMIAQFQLGYKGFIQLGLRSNQFLKLSSAAIYPSNIVSRNPLTGYVFNFDEDPPVGEKPCGYASYFKLLNGFESTFYMTVEQLEGHAKKYSQSYKYDIQYGNKKSLWSTDKEGMYLKTVSKLNLSKFAPLSVEMQQAIQFDQSEVDPKTMGATYPDNNAGFEDAEIVDIDNAEQKVQNRLIKLMEACKTVDELEKFQDKLDSVTEIKYAELWNDFQPKAN